MDVDLIFKIAAVGILVAVLNILLQRCSRRRAQLYRRLRPCCCQRHVCRPDRAPVGKIFPV